MIKDFPKISLKHVNFFLEKKPFFFNFSTVLSNSGITVIVGPNGSGKTLLLKLIIGLIKPQSGRISLGEGVKKIRIGYVSQNIIFLRRNVYQNIAYPLQVRGQKKKDVFERVSYLLEKFGFEEKKSLSARNLSVGNKQYLSIIRSVANDPNLLILDEPSSNLDHKYSKKLEDVLKDEKEKGKKIILVTHDIFQAKRLGEEIIFLKNGKIVEQSSKKNFFSSNNKLVKKLVRGDLF